MSASSQQRVAIVTGTNRGIGRGIAEGLVAHGLVVAATARTQEVADRVASELGNGAFGVALEVTSQASVDAAVDAVLARAGRIDILVNNAGGHYDDGVSPLTLSDAELLDAIDLNLLGPVRLCRAVIPHMRAAGWGRIVNVSSRSGTFTGSWRNAPAYGVSKAALNMFTFQLASALEGSGILANACCPGWVRTDMGGPNADKSIEEGADTPIWLALLPDDGPSGGFFSDRASRRSGPGMVSSCRGRLSPEASGGNCDATSGESGADYRRQPWTRRGAGGVVRCSGCEGGAGGPQC